MCFSTYSECPSTSGDGIGNLAWIIPVAVILGLLVLGGIILLIVLLIVCINVSMCMCVCVCVCVCLHIHMSAHVFLRHMCECVCVMCVLCDYFLS